MFNCVFFLRRERLQNQPSGRPECRKGISGPHISSVLILPVKELEELLPRHCENEFEITERTEGFDLTQFSPRLFAVPYPEREWCCYCCRCRRWVSIIKAKRSRSPRRVCVPTTGHIIRHLLSSSKCQTSLSASLLVSLLFSWLCSARIHTPAHLTRSQKSSFCEIYCRNDVIIN